MQKNKINIIFLDVDGVLNSRAYLNNHKDPEDEIDMRAVERLAKIYRQCNCKIVLSSSWRELCGDEMKAPHSMYKYLESCLAKYGMTIMDVTPMILSNRPEEIDAWLIIKIWSKITSHWMMILMKNIMKALALAAILSRRIFS